MPKMKTKRSAAKRFKRTKKGKFKRHKAFHSHLAQTKSPKRRRNLKKATYASKTDEKKVKSLLPYS